MGAVPVLASVAVAIAVTVVFMFGLRPLALRAGLVDKPGGRKLHEGDIPIIGGLAMFAGIFASLVVIPIPGAVMLSIFAASLLLVLVGVLDDRFHIPALARMTSQIAVVLMMVYGAGFYLADIGEPFATGVISMGSFTLIFTMLVTLTMINAYNLVDGADGLAGTLALIALLSVALAAGLNHPVTPIALAASAAIMGFLIFNFPTPWNRPIRSFMGDAGSTLLGFSVVWITLGVSQGEARVISPVHCLWFAAIPIFDLMTCFVRRAMKGRSPFSAGRDHFHHILQRGGLGVRKTLGILTGLQLVYALVALTGYFLGVPDVVMFTAWSVLGLSQRLVIRQIGRHHRRYRFRKIRELRLRAA